MLDVTQYLNWESCRYGTDKPDTRYGLLMSDVTAIVDGCGFKVFADTMKNGGIVKALCVPEVRLHVKRFRKGAVSTLFLSWSHRLCQWRNSLVNIISLHIEKMEA
jgi:aspartyl-tRNA synthetase